MADYSEELARRPALLVATKCEDERALERAAELAERAGREVLVISAATGLGLRPLLEAVWPFVSAERPPES